MSLAVVVGVGNRFRRDDGVGPVVAEDIARRNRVDLRVVTDVGDSTTLLDVWAGARLAVIVDAAMGEGAAPGRVRRWAPGGTEPDLGAVSCHAMAVPQAYALGAALGRIPDRLVVISIDIADAGYGIGLSPSVAAAVPHAAELVLAELGVQQTGIEVGNGAAVHTDPRTAFSP